MANYLDVCRFFPTAGGTTDWTYSSAVTGYQSPTLAGVVNSTVYRYRAESADLMQWEVGSGAYNTGTGVLARTTVLFNSSGTGTGSGQSGAGTKINFSIVPQVAIVALAEDLPSLSAPNVFSDATASTSSTTGAMTIAGGVGIGGNTYSNGDLYLNNGASGTVFLGNVPTLSRSQATGKLVIATNASDIDFTPASGNVTNSGGFLSRSPSVGIGYATGAGGTVTQATTRNTGVTLSKTSGDIVLFSAINAAVSAATANTVIVTNTTVAIVDTINVVQKSGTDKYLIFVTNVSAGAFSITFFTTGGTTNEAPVFHFNLIKGANS